MLAYCFIAHVPLSACRLQLSCTSVSPFPMEQFAMAGKVPERPTSTPALFISALRDIRTQDLGAGASMTVPCCSDSDSPCSDSDSPMHSSEPSPYMPPTSRQPRSSSPCSSQQLPAPGSPAYWPSGWSPQSSSAQSWKRAVLASNQPEPAWQNTGVPLPLIDAAPNCAATAATAMRIADVRALLAMKVRPTAARATPKRTPTAVPSGAATNTGAATATSSAAADTAKPTPSCTLERPPTVAPSGNATTLGVVYLMPKQRPSRTLQLPSADVPSAAAPTTDDATATSTTAAATTCEARPTSSCRPPTAVPSAAPDVPSAAAHILAFDPPLSPSAKRLQRRRHLLGPPPVASATTPQELVPRGQPPPAVHSAAAHTDGDAAATSNTAAARPRPSWTPPTAVPSAALAVSSVRPTSRMFAEWLGSPPVPSLTTPLELAPCGRPRTDAHSAAAPTIGDATATSIAAAERPLQGPPGPRPPDHPPSVWAIAEAVANRLPFSKARARGNEQLAFSKARARSSQCRSRSRGTCSGRTLVMGGFGGALQL
jgi:hypothetical protein